MRSRARSSPPGDPSPALPSLDQQPIVRAAAWRAAIFGFFTTASVTGFGLGRASAQELDVNDGLISETIASRDRLKTYDNIKKYGAERIVDRERAEPEGLRAGNYLIFPSIGAAVVFDNNIFASGVDRQSDIRSELTPTLTFKSQFPRHVLDLSLGGRIVNYLEHSDQDYASGFADLKGALHFDAAHTLSASLLGALEHEERQDSTASQFAAGPVPVWHDRASVGITRDVGRLYGTLSGAYETWSFQNVAATTGGTLDQSFRDTDVYSGQLRAGYRISPGFDAVARGRVLRVLNEGDGRVSRTATGYELVAGLAMETSPLLRWQLVGGWGWRDFDQTNLSDLQSMLAEGQMQWLVSQRLTFYATLGRTISDQVAANGGGLVESKAEARLEYELWHNLVLSLAGVAALEEFKGVSRTDHVYSGKAGVEYWANKNWLFTFAYEHQVRDSSDDAFAMSRDKVSIGAKLRF